MMMKNLLLIALLALFSASGCSTNPVTGEKELLLISETQELDIGRQNYAPLRQAQGGDYVVDAGIETYVNRVGQRLAAVSDRPLPYEFKVINNSSPNAWALPGGKIAINRGLLTELDSEAELAAVLGHEIVHAAARHSAKGIQRGMLLQGAVFATAIATRDKGYTNLAQLGASVGAQLVNQKYGRDAEPGPATTRRARCSCNRPSSSCPRTAARTGSAACSPATRRHRSALRTTSAMPPPCPRAGRPAVSTTGRWWRG
jgi:predicted Zn-dependent protease